MPYVPNAGGNLWRNSSPCLQAVAHQKRLQVEEYLRPHQDVVPVVVVARDKHVIIGAPFSLSFTAS